jgi:hypothetical protein
MGDQQIGNLLGFRIDDIAAGIRKPEDGFVRGAQLAAKLALLGWDKVSGEIERIILKEASGDKNSGNVLWVTVDDKKERVLEYEIKNGEKLIKAKSREVLLARLLSTLKGRRNQLEL